jgi:hypothetical protein
MPSDTQALTTDEVIQQAPGRDVAVEARSLQMRHFKSKTNIMKCVQTQTIVPLGQIVGVVYDVIEKPGRLPDGTPKTSLLVYGAFEALAYESGEIKQSNAAYLPEYFAKALQVALSKGPAGASIQIGIEVVAEPTGLDEKTGLPRVVPFSYGVKNLIARRADDPIEEVKRRMGNRLRLPAPAPLVTRDQARVALPDGDNAPAKPVPDTLAEDAAPVPAEDAAPVPAEDVAETRVASRKKAS